MSWLPSAAPSWRGQRTWIDRHGSLTGAAHALGVTPAAVTQQVARAERDWNAPLVVRGPRGASLTAAGALLAEHGRIIDEQTDRAGERLAALLGHLSLRLRVGAFLAAALHLLPPALTALRHRYPKADVSVEDLLSDRGVERVAAGELDVAVIVLPDDHPLVTGSPEGAPLRLEQLRDESWVTVLAGHAAREQLDRAAGRAGFTPRIRFQTASYDLAQALVGTGYGVALVSRLALTRVPGTTHRPLADPPLHRDLHTVTRSDTALTPLADVFCALLLDGGRAQGRLAVTGVSGRPSWRRPRTAARPR